jgi:hypothetical protein
MNGRRQAAKTQEKAAVMPIPPHELPPSKPTTRRADDMPIVSEFGRADMDKVIGLLQASVEYQEQERAIKESKDLIKQQLSEILARREVPGCRWGSLVCYYNGAVTRKTLDKGLLLLNGVTAEQIEASYKESKPFVELRVKDLAKADFKDDN